MRDAIKRYVDAAQSLTEMSRDRAERVARGLAGNGLIGGDQIRDVASDLVRRSRENRERVTELVSRELRKQVARLGLATKDDLEQLTRRIRKLEAPPEPAKEPRQRGVPSRKAKPVAAARKAPARKKPVSRGPARKPAARKPAARRPAARTRAAGSRRRPASAR